MQFAAVTVQDVLDDREPETGAAEFAAARRVDSVEPLGQPRQMVRCDAVATIGDGNPYQPAARNQQVVRGVLRLAGGERDGGSLRDRT